MYLGLQCSCMYKNSTRSASYNFLLFLWHRSHLHLVYSWCSFFLKKYLSERWWLADTNKNKWSVIFVWFILGIRACLDAVLDGICLGWSLPGIFLDDVWLKPWQVAWHRQGLKSQAMKIGCLAPVAFFGWLNYGWCIVYCLLLLVHPIKWETCYFFF
jgi:hypothetical protein